LWNLVHLDWHGLSQAPLFSNFPLPSPLDVLLPPHFFEQVPPTEWLFCSSKLVFVRCRLLFFGTVSSSFLFSTWPVLPAFCGISPVFFLRPLMARPCGVPFRRTSLVFFVGGPPQVSSFFILVVPFFQGFFFCTHPDPEVIIFSPVGKTTPRFPFPPFFLLRGPGEDEHVLLFARPPLPFFRLNLCSLSDYVGTPPLNTRFFFAHSPGTLPALTPSQDPFLVPCANSICR